MTLCRVMVSEVDLHNAGKKGVEVDIPYGAVIVEVKRRSPYDWDITYYVGHA